MWIQGQRRICSNRYGKPLAEYRSADIYRKREEAIDEAIYESHLNEYERNEWERMESEVVKPIVYHSTETANASIDIIENAPLIMMFVIAICISQLFAGEVKDRTDPLIRASMLGFD